MVDPLPCNALRWRCDPDRLDFETTDDVEPIVGVIGQHSAVDALKFGLEVDAPGQNIFIRGLTGTGRMTLVQRLLEELQPKCAAKYDRCYVHNFAVPDRPRLLTLPAGRARAFRRRVHELAEFVRDDLQAALGADALKARRESLQRRQKEEIEALTEPFERDLKAASLTLVSMQLGPVTQTAIFPLVEGKPMPPEEFDQLETQGKVSAEEVARFKERRDAFQSRLEEVTEKIREIRRRSERSIHSVVEETARAVVGDMAREILIDFPGDDVQKFLSEVVDDVGENRVSEQQEVDLIELYGVNILLEHDQDDACPIITENTPTLSNLLGHVDREWTPKVPARSDYRMVRAGSILRADGGYLILDAREVLIEPGAWRVLLRTLKNGRLEIVPTEFAMPMWAPALNPEPIPVRVKVILLGDAGIYHILDQHDPDFGNLFKVLADFDPEIAREPEGVLQYGGVLARIAKDEKLPPFHKTAVAALVEHGARIAARHDKLTARFSRVADIAREAAYLARKADNGNVTGEHIEEAIRRTKRRADLPSRRFREYLADGTIQIQTSGSVVGQVNGLAVIRAGPIMYGFPARITASMGAGTAGIINIEGQAQLSGAIHTKGFHILGGLLRHLLRAEHPLAFSASVAFEQSYGGIDGDSASGAEICCLLSALTKIPIRQEVAITGAIDQVGHLQAIGGVNEKIEGFFDTCRDLGLTGDQGVVIPKSNAGDLMLRADVVEACSNGQFHVYAVETIQEALEVLTGVPAGEPDEEGAYPEDSLLGKAVEQARQYWIKSIFRPDIKLEDGEETEEEEAADEEEAAAEPS
ncbi:MAG: Lon protease family protein [Planctomycetota bacterium]|jgi:ATP-dependent Lon protease